jgi:hypothetical protein
MDKQHPFVLFLVVPEIVRRGVAAGDDTFDPDGVAPGQGFAEFFGQVARNVGEEVVHSATTQAAIAG